MGEGREKKNEQAQAGARASARTAPSGGPTLRPWGSVSPSGSGSHTSLLPSPDSGAVRAPTPRGPTAQPRLPQARQRTTHGSRARHTREGPSPDTFHCPCPEINVLHAREHRSPSSARRRAGRLQHHTFPRPDTEGQGPRCSDQRESPTHQPARQRGPADVRGRGPGRTENEAMEPVLRTRKQLQTALCETCIRHRELCQVNDKVIKAN